MLALADRGVRVLSWCSFTCPCTDIKATPAIVAAELSTGSDPILQLQSN